MKVTGVRKNPLVIILAFCILALAGCGGTSNTPAPTTSISTQAPAPMQSTATSTEQPVPVISGNQVTGSDIPDTQVFVTYTSTDGKYQLDIPEGWAQKINGANVSFTSNLNILQVTLSKAATQPKASSVRNDQEISLQQT